MQFDEEESGLHRRQRDAGTGSKAMYVKPAMY